MKKFLSRYYSLLTAIAFLINVMLPFYAVYNIPQASAKEASSLFGDKILICTADGFKWFSWQDLQSGKEQPKPHSQFKCPVCYVAVHGVKHTLPQSNIELGYDSFSYKVQFQLSLAEVFTPPYFLSGRLGRAPPVVV
jgi:hypothetical protein